MTQLSASVIIPTRNRPRAVESCLDALAAQTLPAGSFEVIVVDDGSEPPLSLDAARWAAKFDLKLIRQNNTGPAGARNRGVTEARGEFLAFTDDDCLPTPTWLEKLVAALREHPEALIGGSTFNGLKDDIFAETSQLIIEMVYEHFNRDPANTYFFASNNIAVHRDRYLASGGFDADSDLPAAEDREFCDRWRMQKHPLFWERTALVEHRHAQSLGGFIRLHWRYGQGAFLYQAKRKQRASGTMAEDLGFHRKLPKVARVKISSHRLGKRAQLLVALTIWQIANAMGFFHEMVSSHKGRAKAQRVQSLLQTPAPFFSRILETLSPGFLSGFAFPDWVRLLHANRWRIDARYLPRAVFATFGSMATSAVKVVEDRIELPPLSQDLSQQPLFVLGLPRSGTTHLFHLLSEDAQFCFPTRFDAFNPHTFITLRSLGLASLFGKQALRKRPMDNVMTGWLMPEEDNIALAIMTGFGTRIEAVFRRHSKQEFSRVGCEGGPDAERFKAALTLFLRKLTRLHQRPVLLKSPSHTLAVPQILSAVPYARFVTIIRDPIAQFKSLAAMRATAAVTWSALQCAPPYNEDVLLDRIGLFARKYCDTRGLIPKGQLVEIRYEDLIADEAGTLKRIYKQLDLKPRATTQPKPQKRYQTNKHPDLPVDLRARVIKASTPFYETSPFHVNPSARAGGCA